MSQAQATKKQGGLSAGIVIIIAMILCNLLFYFVFSKQLDEKGHPTNFMGLIFKGGWVVPFLLGTFLTCIIFTVERLLTISKAKGTGSVENFLRVVKSKLAANDINGAIAECNKQKGSVANVVQAGLHKYDEMSKNTQLEGEKKILAIQQEVEESTSLELPALEKNMWILATIASVGTLLALFGTVLGMIRSFAALAGAGGTDPEALAVGISEALINTAIGIITSAIAIVAYNLCTNMIDKLTYSIDEMGYTISQTFAARKN